MRGERATGGLDGVATRLLALCDRLLVPGSGAHDLEPVAMGYEAVATLMGPARTSLTPYVAPWHGSSFQQHVRKGQVLLEVVAKEAVQHVDRRAAEPAGQVRARRLRPRTRRREAALAAARSLPAVGAAMPVSGPHSGVWGPFRVGAVRK